jgi:phage terminase large subunit
MLQGNVLFDRCAMFWLHFGLYEDFFQLQIRTTEQIFADYNPSDNISWIYDLIEQRADDVSFFKTTYKDNRFLPQEYINTLLELAKYNDTYYKIYVLGEFATLDKLIFPNFTIEDGLAERMLNKRKSVGVDFGYTNDPTTAVEIHYDKSLKTIYITDEIYGKGMMTKEIADSLREQGFTNYPIIADCADPRLIAELRQLGIALQPAKKGKDSVLFGITWLQANNIIIDSKCVKTIEEFQNYTWQKDRNTNQYYNTPIDGWNHCIDALRYAVEQYSTGSAVRTLNKSALGI